MELVDHTNTSADNLGAALDSERANLTDVAEALLQRLTGPCAYRVFFEASVARMLPVGFISAAQIAHAIQQLAGQGVIVEWTPPAGDDPKPHPQLCLRKYWPAGKIWEVHTSTRD